MPTPPTHHPTRARARFRQPLPPRPIDPCTLTHPRVPPHLDGFRILHISDLHIRRRPGRNSTLTHLLDAVARTPVDLIALTGDFMHHPGHEDFALAYLARLLDAADTRLGVFGIFGNHDTAAFIRRARELPATWLLHDAVRPASGLCLLGAGDPEDLPSCILDAGASRENELTIALTHCPNQIIPGAELGVDILFAGHTHAGQWRPYRRLCPHTSCDLPMHLASGVLRFRDTLCVISRGLGEAIFELRINCPRHAPLITLRRAPLPTIEPRRSETITQLLAW